MAECFLMRNSVNNTSTEFIGGLKNTTCQINLNTMVASNCQSSSSSGNNILINNDDTEFIFLPENSDWEMCFKFRFNELKSLSVVVGSGYYGKYMYTPSIELTKSQGVIWAGASTNGTDWDIQGSTQEGRIEVNKDYWVKFSYTSVEGYGCYLSEDGMNFETIFISTNTNIQYQSQINSKMQLFDVACHGTHINTKGSIDLKNSYIKFGDSVVWGARR